MHARDKGARLRSLQRKSVRATPAAARLQRRIGMLVPACRERGVSRAGVIGSQGRGSIRLCPPMLPRFPDAGGAAYRGQSGAPLLASSSSPRIPGRGAVGFGLRRTWAGDGHLVETGAYWVNGQAHRRTHVRSTAPPVWGSVACHRYLSKWAGGTHYRLQDRGQRARLDR